VLSGIKTQSLDASQSGDGGYNQLVFDDSPGQSRSSLMSTQAHSQLNLGHQKHQHDNARKASLGHGAELTTQGAAALRAGQGLLISTDAKPHASGQLMDTREASSQMEQSQQLAKALLDTAQKQNAKLKGELAPDKLPMMLAYDDVQESLKAVEVRDALTMARTAAADFKSNKKNESPKSSTEKFDQHFLLINNQTGAALAYASYRITLSDGRVFEGVSDDSGKTVLVTADTPLKANIEVFV
jgi:type VI secretion system secreted protein VgrG